MSDDEIVPDSEDEILVEFPNSQRLARAPSDNEDAPPRKRRKLSREDSHDEIDFLSRRNKENASDRQSNTAKIAMPSTASRRPESVQPLSPHNLQNQPLFTPSPPSRNAEGPSVQSPVESQATPVTSPVREPSMDLDMPGFSSSSPSFPHRSSTPDFASQSSLPIHSPRGSSPSSVCSPPKIPPTFDSPSRLHTSLPSSSRSRSPALSPPALQLPDVPQDTFGDAQASKRSLRPRKADQIAPYTSDYRRYQLQLRYHKDAIVKRPRNHHDNDEHSAGEEKDGDDPEYEAPPSPPKRKSREDKGKRREERLVGFDRLSDSDSDVERTRKEIEDRNNALADATRENNTSKPKRLRRRPREIPLDMEPGPSRRGTYIELSDDSDMSMASQSPQSSSSRREKRRMRSPTPTQEDSLGFENHLDDANWRQPQPLYLSRHRSPRAVSSRPSRPLETGPHIDFSSSPATDGRTAFYLGSSSPPSPTNSFDNDNGLPDIQPISPTLSIDELSDADSSSSSLDAQETFYRQRQFRGEAEEHNQIDWMLSHARRQRTSVSGRSRVRKRPSKSNHAHRGRNSSSNHNPTSHRSRPQGQNGRLSGNPNRLDIAVGGASRSTQITLTDAFQKQSRRNSRKDLSPSDQRHTSSSRKPAKPPSTFTKRRQTWSADFSPPPSDLNEGEDFLPNARPEKGRHHHMFIPDDDSPQAVARREAKEEERKRKLRRREKMRQGDTYCFVAQGVGHVEGLVTRSRPALTKSTPRQKVRRRAPPIVGGSKGAPFLSQHNVRQAAQRIGRGNRQLSAFETLARHAPINILRELSVMPTGSGLDLPANDDLAPVDDPPPSPLHIDGQITMLIERPKEGNLFPGSSWCRNGYLSSLMSSLQGHAPADDAHHPFENALGVSLDPLHPEGLVEDLKIFFTALSDFVINLPQDDYSFRAKDCLHRVFPGVSQMLSVAVHSSPWLGPLLGSVIQDFAQKLQDSNQGIDEFMIVTHWWALENLLRVGSRFGEPDSGDTALSLLLTRLLQLLLIHGRTYDILPASNFAEMDAAVANVWLHLLHVADALAFLPVVFKLLRDQVAETYATATCPQIFAETDFIFRLLFSLQYLCYVNADGHSLSSENISIGEQWAIVQVALSRLVLNYRGGDADADPEAVRDVLAIVTVGRCFRLASYWQWEASSALGPVLKSLLSFSSSRHFADIDSELWPLVPDFLQYPGWDIHSRVPSDTEPDEPMFAKMLRLSGHYAKARGVPEEELEVRRANVTSWIFPQGGKVKFSDEPTKTELSMFYNRVAAVACAIEIRPGFSDNDIKNRLFSYAPPKSTKSPDARLAMFTAFVALGRLLIRSGRSLEPLLDWVRVIRGPLFIDAFGLDIDNKEHPLEVTPQDDLCIRRHLASDAAANARFNVIQLLGAVRLVAQSCRETRTPLNIALLVFFHPLFSIKMLYRYNQPHNSVWKHAKDFLEVWVEIASMMQSSSKVGVLFEDSQGRFEDDEDDEEENELGQRESQLIQAEILDPILSILTSYITWTKQSSLRLELHPWIEGWVSLAVLYPTRRPSEMGTLYEPFRSRWVENLKAPNRDFQAAKAEAACCILAKFPPRTQVPTAMVTDLLQYFSDQFISSYYPESAISDNFVLLVPRIWGMLPLLRGEFSLADFTIEAGTNFIDHSASRRAKIAFIETLLHNLEALHISRDPACDDFAYKYCLSLFQNLSSAILGLDKDLTAKRELVDDCFQIWNVLNAFEEKGGGMAQFAWYFKWGRREGNDEGWLWKQREQLVALVN